MLPKQNNISLIDGTIIDLLGHNIYSLRKFAGTDMYKKTCQLITVN